MSNREAPGARWPPSSRRNAATILVLAVVVGALLRLHNLAKYGFNGDEVFSLETALLPWPQLFVAAARDLVHPPLFYVLLKLWLGVGPAVEWWTRLLPLLFGLALIPAAFAISRRLPLSLATAAFVTALIVLNNLLIVYSDFLRMFTVLEFFALVSILSYLDLFGETSFRWKYIQITLANVLLVYSHYWGWAVIAAEGFVTLTSDRSRLRLMLSSTAIVALAFLPWAIAVFVAAGRLRAGMTHHIGWMGAGTPGVSDYAWLIAMFNGSLELPHSTIVGIVLFMFPVVLVCRRQFCGPRRTWLAPTAPVFWLVLILVPLALTSVMSLLTRQDLFGYRHLSMLAVPYFLMIAVSLEGLRRPLARSALAAVMLAWAVAASGAAWFDKNQELDWPGLAAGIAARGPAPVYASESFIQLPLSYRLSRLKAPTGAVAITDEPEAIAAPTFWFVYRDITWQRRDPKAILADKNETVLLRLSTRAEPGHAGGSRQEVIALLIRRD